MSRKEGIGKTFHDSIHQHNLRPRSNDDQTFLHIYCIPNNADSYTVVLHCKLHRIVLLANLLFQCEYTPCFRGPSLLRYQYSSQEKYALYSYFDFVGMMNHGRDLSMYLGQPQVSFIRLVPCQLFHRLPRCSLTFTFSLSS